MAASQHAAKLVYLLVAILLAGGLCALRVRQMKSAQEEHVTAALVAMRDAIFAPPSEQQARFALAHEAAREAARSTVLLLDPYATFLLTVTEKLGDACEVGEPPADAPTLRRVTWLIAHGRLDGAGRTLEGALAASEGASTATTAELKTWLRLVRDVQALGEPSTPAPPPVE